MTDPALSAVSLSADYGAEPVLTGLSLMVPRGQFMALLGANGCGKSTLLQCLAGVMAPRRGRVQIGDRNIATMSAKERARQVALLAQGPRAPEGLRVEELVRQGRYPHRGLFSGWTDRDQEAVNRALSLTGMEALRSRALDSLSGGQRQRAWLAMTLAQQGQILLLDEPTSFLDLAHQIDLLDLMKQLIVQEALTVVAVLHDINQAARYADRIVCLRDGAVLAEGAPETVITEANLRAVFDVEARIISDPETGAPMVIPRRPG